MGCPSCGAAVPLDKRFCVECGAALPPRCPACGGASPPGARFCGDCGAALGAGVQAGATATGAAAATPPAAATATEPERRQLTVLFADLVGSTALAARLDPEDLREVIGRYHRCVAEVVGRFEGHVAKYLGDGVLAYFGWPRAHEDDAERAVRAGLAVVEAVATTAAPGGEALAARAGIATGLVVVGDLIGEGAAREEAVVGETPNLAARLQALAAPGGVVIGERTRRLVGDLFELDDLGARALKGFAAPVRVWRVLGPGRAEGRFEARQAGGLTPLVGREEELALLLRRWELARDGEGQVVLLSGEPGIGKSRLAQTLRERVAGEPHVRLRYQCSPYHVNSALYPVIDQLQRAAGFQRDDTAGVKLAKLEALLAEGTAGVAAIAPLFADLLSIPAGERYAPLELTPQRRKERLFAALLDQLAGLAAERPVLALYEDAHWIDPTTAELVGLAVERVRGLSVLLVITFRPEFQPPWPGHAHVTALSLSRLGRRQVAAMVERVAGGKALPAEVVEQLAARTDGVPLFVEELTKTVLESGLLADRGDRYELVGPLPPPAIPATLHDSLMARLDRLAPVKEVAQIGAAIGREFSHELLAAVTRMADDRLRDALDQLARSELIFRRGVPPEAVYIFKHALVQDAAYQSLLRSRRQQLHTRIATVLAERFPETAENRPEVLAHHYTEAGLTEQAIAYWDKAGRRAGERSANAEAVAHLTRALGLVEGLPDTAERARRELQLQLALGPVLVNTKSYAAAEVEQAYLRARELCREVGDPTQLLSTTYGVWLANIARMRLDPARALAEEMLALARERSDPAFLLQAHHVAWTTLFCTAELTACLDHAEQGRALYDPDAHRAHKFLFGGHDPGVCGYNHEALALWLLGYPDRAVVRVNEGRGLARDLGHDFTLVLATQISASIDQYRGDTASTREFAEEMVAIATEKAVGPHFLAVGRILLGWAAIVDRRAGEEGLAEIRDGLARLEATGVQFRRPYYLTLYADACARAGRVAEGLVSLAQALRCAERSWEAEAHRLRGELLLAQAAGNLGEAEACFGRALEVARRQGARSLELRAATSLARLWGEGGRRAEARDLLAPVYGWFTEGFDTADLVEAKALLSELA